MVGWITALKIIPWGDVIEAAPAIAKGARKFFSRTEATTREAAEQVAETPAGDVSARIRQLESSVAEMAQQQKASAELIESLADQNAQVVHAVDVLRVRTRLLVVVVAVQCAALVALAVAVWR